MNTTTMTAAPVVSWGVEDVCHALAAGRVSAGAVGKFRENEVDGAALLTVTKGDLREELCITSLQDRKEAWRVIEAAQARAASEPAPRVASPAPLPRPGSAVKLTGERLQELAATKGRADPVASLDTEMAQRPPSAALEQRLGLGRKRQTIEDAKALDAATLHALSASPARASSSGSEAGTSPGPSAASTPVQRRSVASPAPATPAPVTTASTPAARVDTQAPAPVAVSKPAAAVTVTAMPAPAAVTQGLPTKEVTFPARRGVTPASTAREVYETTGDYARSASVEDKILWERAAWEHLEQDVQGAQEVMKTIHFDTPLGNRGALTAVDRHRIAIRNANEPLAAAVSSVHPVTKLTSSNPGVDYKAIQENAAAAQRKNDSAYEQHQALMAHLDSQGVLGPAMNAGRQ